MLMVRIARYSYNSSHIHMGATTDTEPKNDVENTLPPVPQGIDHGIVAIMFGNFWSSVGIIFTNKAVFFSYEFTFGTLVTAGHFLVTAMCLHICRQYGVFEAKTLEPRKLLSFSLVFCLSIVLNNLSLQENSIGFYQVMKILTTPTIVVIEQIFYGETLSLNLKLALLPVCIGVAIATVTDVEVNFLGSVYASAGVIMSSVYQIWARTKLKELGVNSFQLLYYQAPMSCAMLLGLFPWLDDFNKFKEYEWTASAAFAIAASSVIAFAVNLTTFLVIGKTSPVTYNVLGHLKTCVILVGGYFIFGTPMTFENIVGVLMTLGGIITYTHLKISK